MPRKVDIKKVKADLKAANAAEREAKKDITIFQKAFLETLGDTDHDKNVAKDDAANYRAAVADHIKAVQARAKLEAKIEAASE